MKESIVFFYSADFEDNWWPEDAFTVTHLNDDDLYEWAIKKCEDEGWAGYSGFAQKRKNLTKE